MKPMNPNDIRYMIVTRIGQGLDAAGYVIRKLLQSTLGVQAPLNIGKPLTMKQARSYRGFSIRALTKATPGAPPRRVSGRLQASITWQKVSEFAIRVGTDVFYGKYLEYGNHPWLEKTILRYRRELEKIVGARLSVTEV